MKKLFIALSIVIILILGVFTTAVMAAPEPKPLDAWQYIVDKVDEIYDMVFSIDNDVSEVDGMLGEMEFTVSEVESKLDDLSNVVRMETDSRVIEVPAGTNPFDITEIGGDYDEIRHVVVTLLVYPGILEAPDMNGADRINVGAYWPGNILGWRVATIDHNTDTRAQTFEFNAQYWTIDFESNDSSGYTVRWATTTTYVPAPEP